MKASVHIAALVALGVSEEVARAKAADLIRKGEKITEDDAGLGAAKLVKASERLDALLEAGLDKAEADELVKGQIADGTLLDDLAKADDGEPASLEKATAEIDGAIEALEKAKKKAKKPEPEPEYEPSAGTDDPDDDGEPDEDEDMDKGADPSDVADMLSKAISATIGTEVRKALAPVLDALTVMAKGQRATLASLAKGATDPADGITAPRGFADPRTVDVVPHPLGNATDKPANGGIRKGVTLNREAVLRKAGDLADNGPRETRRAAADVVDLIEKGASDARILDFIATAKLADLAA